jgi:oxygen-independent coproporphyrinogen-3 oxidase
MVPGSQNLSGNSQLAGLYIHIPFCQRKCPYCDFFSISDLAQAQPFLSALEQEMALASQTSLEFDTVYLGGGTPSVLDVYAVELIIADAYKYFNIRSDAEVTIEVNPGTVMLDDLRRYHLAGINRLNIGIQSFNDNNLKFLGRIHSSHEAATSLDWACRAGFDNVGLDLIYGLPQQTETLWMEDLKHAIQNSPEHISCYILTRETGTQLDREMAAGRINLPAEDHLRTLFESTIEFLTSHHYWHYEISNFARPAADGRSFWISRHNCKYWSFAPYIGLGPSAHSYLEPERHWNHARIEDYLMNIRSGNLPIAGRETLTSEQMMIEALYLGFRTTAGINLRAFKRKFGVDFMKIYQKTISELKKSGLIATSETRCALTSKGMALLDSITAEFANQEIR